MKVLQLANGYFGNRLYENLFEVQKNVGIENTIYVPIKKGETVPPVETNYILVSPCFSQFDRVLFFSKQKKMLRDLEKLNVAQFDVIHAHTVFSGGYAAYQLYRKYGVPYIVAVRNTDVTVFFKYMVHLRKVGVDIMRHAEKVVFLSTTYQAQVIQKYIPVGYQEEIRQKSVVIPNGIAPIFLDNLYRRQRKLESVLRLIYVGELSRNKNLELTVQAAELLRKQGTEVTLTAVGKITDDNYVSLIEKTPFLTHYDRCPQDEVIQHLRNADLFVMPSHHETFGLVYAEAMSQGLPVIYTRGQGFDGQFPEATVGYAVSDVDAAELVRRIEQVVSNYEEISSNCVRLADEFNWDHIVQQYKGIYHQISLKGKK